MKVEVTICKYDLATGKIDGMIYSDVYKGSKRKLFESVLAAALQKCGITSNINCAIKNIEDEDGIGLGHIAYCGEIDGIEYRITIMTQTALWDHSFEEC